MKDKEIEKLVDKIAIEKSKSLAQNRFDFSYVRALLEVSKIGISPKGVFMKKCPKCGSKLDFVDIEDFGALTEIYRYFECVNCDYWHMKICASHSIGG